MTDAHDRFMQAALSLAQRNLGQTWPNPTVGAVIVKGGQIVAEAVTARGGRPHAETQAIEQAGHHHTKGATLYVTLEPCAHHGQTGPCTDAIIKAGITHCVVACRDTYPKVSGQGIEQLKRAGIEVTEGVREKEALELNRGFFSVVHKKRPFVSLKFATSLDGKMATATRESKWITSDAARQYGHKLRSTYDAIATGIGTVRADNPNLTCRIAGLEDRSPVRVVYDSSLRMPADSHLLMDTKRVPTWILTASGDHLPGKSAKLWRCPEDANGHIDLAQSLHILADQGITRLLVEAGPTLSTAFLSAGLVDRIYWFRAPFMIGSEGVNAAANGFSPVISELARMHPIAHIALPPDQLDIFECLPASSQA